MQHACVFVWHIHWLECTNIVFLTIISLSWSEARHTHYNSKTTQALCLKQSYITIKMVMHFYQLLDICTEWYSLSSGKGPAGVMWVCGVLRILQIIKLSRIISVWYMLSNVRASATVHDFAVFLSRWPPYLRLPKVSTVSYNILRPEPMTAILQMTLQKHFVECKIYLLFYILWLFLPYGGFGSKSEVWLRQ